MTTAQLAIRSDEDRRNARVFFPFFFSFFFLFREVLANCFLSITAHFVSEAECLVVANRLTSGLWCVSVVRCVSSFHAVGRLACLLALCLFIFPIPPWLLSCMPLGRQFHFISKSNHCQCLRVCVCVDVVAPAPPVYIFGSAFSSVEWGALLPKNFFFFPARVPKLHALAWLDVCEVTVKCPLECFYVAFCHFVPAWLHLVWMWGATS